MNQYIFPLALASGLFAALGGFFAKRQRDRLHLVLAFSGGAVLAVALCHLLPEAIELTESVRLATVLVVSGFIAIMAGDQLFSIHQHEDCENPSHGGRFSALAMTLHGVVDGVAVAMAFLASTEIGIGVAAAVLAHKFSDGVNVSASVMRYDSKSVAGWIWLNAAAPLLGAALAVVLDPPRSTLGPVLAIFAGMFLYIGGGSLIPEAHHEHPTITTTLSVLLGMGFVFLVSYFSP